MNCRFCGHQLSREFINLVNAPPSNAFLTREQLNEPETFYPLKLFVCGQCFLVQIDEYQKSGEIFNDKYVYFSSFSKTWLEHARKYAEQMIVRFAINRDYRVIEIASNDGYLLQYFRARGIPVLGIEPAANTARVAIAKGIETITEFFGTDLARRLAGQDRKADLLVGNNVLAHVPDINDFVAGLKILLKKNGVITLEFPHLMRLVELNQFDTVYHEHFSYFSFRTVTRIFAKHRLEIFDVEEIPTHGGSLRIYAGHPSEKNRSVSGRVRNLARREQVRKMDTLAYYRDFQAKADRSKSRLLQFLIQQKRRGKKVAGYGAAAKGNTLLNYCGVKTDLLPFVADVSPYKQGKFLPGSHIPVVDESRIKTFRPDYVVIFPWNLKEEIITQLSYIRDWGGKFVTAVPNLKIT